MRDNIGKHFRDSGRRRISHDIKQSTRRLAMFAVLQTLSAWRHLQPLHLQQMQSRWEGSDLLCTVGVKSLSSPGEEPSLAERVPRDGPNVLSRLER